MKKEKAGVYPYGTKLRFNKSADYTVNFSVKEEKKRPKLKTTYDVSVELAVRIPESEQQIECIVFFDPKEKKLAVDNDSVGIINNQVRVTEESFSKKGVKDAKDIANGIIATNGNVE